MSVPPVDPLLHPHDDDGDSGAPLPFLPRPATLLSKAEYKHLVIGLVDECKKHAVYDVMHGSDKDKNNAWNEAFQDFFHPLVGPGRGFHCAGGEKPVKEFKNMVINELWPQIAQDIGDKILKVDGYELEEYEAEAMKQYHRWDANNRKLKAIREKEQRDMEAKEKAEIEAEIALGGVPRGAFRKPKFLDHGPVQNVSLAVQIHEEEVLPIANEDTDQTPPQSAPTTSANLSRMVLQPLFDIQTLFNAENIEKVIDQAFAKRKHDENCNEDVERKRLDSYRASYNFYKQHGDLARAEKFYKKIISLEEKLDGI